MLFSDTKPPRVRFGKEDCRENIEYCAVKLVKGQVIVRCEGSMGNGIGFARMNTFQALYKAFEQGERIDRV